ncbi:hypothetical protein [Planctomyces sp. SH-PL62]|uniref:hypothetical protein n=1 Tax=Planctomyces sp. SH-PL62 TaxID=1636152 RepID=UPI00078B78B6|nr:hypothetical protein [Planctomyces sp. SH-PL62]AMV39347.1 hypothetical protein VT85_18060 [Planctomyces sp. SH-PL62]
MSLSSLRELSSRWTGRLAHYNSHRNDEHLNALYEETLRFVGLHLENDLCRSEYWSRVPLHSRLVVLLYLVDQGAVEWTVRHGRHVFAAAPHSEEWIGRQAELRPFAKATLELVASLRYDAARRARSRKS